MKSETSTEEEEISEEQLRNFSATLRFSTAGFFIRMSKGKGQATSERTDTVKFNYDARGKVTGNTQTLPKGVLEAIESRIKGRSPVQKLNRRVARDVY